ncbi:unnamed protein product [Danaus chrysippus]|uniref:(African queen) hypothetical protein n=1 Tax=Danaus chrysippus TaxID=151541 RepID=A0A8J2W8E7_9NEOP|nr:unnamed protein product [Danaus chrysippus]
MNYRLGSIVHSPSGCSLCGSNQASAREGCELEGCANLARAAPEPRVDTGGRGAAPPAPRAAALSPPLAPPDPPPRRMRNVNRYQCASALVYRCTTTTITTTKEECVITHTHTYITIGSRDKDEGHEDTRGPTDIHSERIQRYICRDAQYKR